MHVKDWLIKVLGNIEVAQLKSRIDELERRVNAMPDLSQLVHKSYINDSKTKENVDKI